MLLGYVSGPTFQWWPLYYVFKQSFYNSELDSRLTKQNEVSRNGVHRLSLVKLDL